MTAAFCAAMLAASGAMAASPAPTPSPLPAMRGDGPPPQAKPFRIDRADVALDGVISPRARLDTLASGFGLNEGPVWMPDGREGFLLISGLLDNVIYRIDADGKVGVFLERAGYTGNDVENVGAQTRSGRSHVLLIGPSCTGRDSPWPGASTRNAVTPRSSR